MAISVGMEEAFRLREVFSKSFNAFGRHVVVFLMLSAIAHIPSLSLSLWEFTWVRDARVLLRWMVLVDQLTFVVGFVCVVIAYGTIIHGVVEDLAGRRVSIAAAVAIAVRRLLPLVGVSAAALLLSRLGMGLVSPAFIVLSTYWLVTLMFFMVAPVCIAERVGVGAALSRCRFLTKGHRWQILVTVLLLGTIGRAIEVAWGAAVGGAWGAAVGGQRAIVAFYGIWVVFGAFNAVMAAVFYDRLRLAKDGAHYFAKIFD